MSVQPVNYLLFKGQNDPIPPRLVDWHLEKVVLSTAKAPFVPNLTLPDSKEIKLTVGENIRAKWDRMACIITPRLAFPSIVLGVIFSLVGATACITIISGINIPDLDFILKNIPVSLTFSLSLLRGGIHTINSGILASRKHNRFRQETSYDYQKFRVLQATGALKLEEQQAYSKEILRLNNRLAKSLSIESSNQSKGYASTKVDLPYTIADQAVREIHNAFMSRPDLVQPTCQPQIRSIPSSGSVDTNSLKSKKLSQKGFFDKFYDYFYTRQATLGKLDIAIGQFMLLSALFGLVFICFPNVGSSYLEIFANDPYLSLPFAFILLVHWINCTRTGWRMLTFNKRENKRAEFEERLQLVNLGMEKARFEAYYQWAKERLEKALDETHTDPDKRTHIQSILGAINQTKDRFMQEIDAYKPRILKVLSSVELEGSRDSELRSSTKSLHLFGNSFVPSLATPSILIGIIILAMGFACIGFVTGIVPHITELLTNNTSLSIIFGTSLLVIGFNSIYRGVSLSDFKDKQTQKQSSMHQIDELISKLFFEDDQMCRNQRIAFFLEKPSLPESSSQAGKKGISATTANLSLSESAQARGEQWKSHLKDYQKRLEYRNCWYSFWLNRTNKPYFWGSQLLLGSFLVVVSVAGLCMVMGAPPPPFLDFIAQEPSASATFFFSLLAVGVDAINNFYRIMTYTNRKKEDKDGHIVLEMAYQKIFPQLPYSSSQLSLSLSKV